jgi:hypothetical protein
MFVSVRIIFTACLLVSTIAAADSTVPTTTPTIPPATDTGAAKDPGADTTAFGGDVFSFSPKSHMDGGDIGIWLAGTIGPTFYVGGEIAGESFSVHDGDFGFSYHALAGFKTKLSDSFRFLLDGGAGVTQELKVNLALFGGQSSVHTAAWTPSAAVRAQLVWVLATIRGYQTGFALETEARGGVHLGNMPAERTSGGVGVGLAFYIGH